MNWIIEPLIGLGPLRIGMSAKEVAKILDPVHPVTDRSVVFDGSIEENRGLLVPSCSYNGDVLRGIDTNYRIENVIFDGINVYKSKPRDIMIMISDKNGGAKYGVGMLLFDNLTITTNGFFDGKKWFYQNNNGEEQDERTVSIYRKNTFDPLMSQFKKIDLKKYK